MGENKSVDVLELIRRAQEGLPHEEELHVGSQVEALALISLIVLQAGGRGMGTRTTMSTAAECASGVHLVHGLRANICLADRHGRIMGVIVIK